MVPPVNEPTPENQQNEPETPQSESTIPIDGHNAPTQIFETKRQIESHETDVIQPKFHPPKTYVFPKTKIGSRERLFHAHCVKTTLGCIITQKKMQHFVMYVYQIKRKNITDLGLVKT